MSESFEHSGGLSEKEKQQLQDFLDTEEGRATLARRLGKISEEVTYQEVEDLYRKNPSPIFFAKEVKLDEVDNHPGFECIKLPPEEESEKSKAA